MPRNTVETTTRLTSGQEIPLTMEDWEVCIRLPAGCQAPRFALADLQPAIDELEAMQRRRHAEVRLEEGGTLKGP